MSNGKKNVKLDGFILGAYAAIAGGFPYRGGRSRFRLFLVQFKTITVWRSPRFPATGGVIRTQPPLVTA